MENRDIALLIAQVLYDKKSEDIDIIDISEKSGFADYFVIATARSLRQLKSLADELEDKLEQEGVFVRHVEGLNDSGWVLMDYGDIIVNLFTQEQRVHYFIERLWSDCPVVEFEPAVKDE